MCMFLRYFGEMMGPNGEKVLSLVSINEWNKLWAKMTKIKVKYRSDWCKLSCLFPGYLM